ncbi:MAG: alpha/beta fold hydrolase [Pseudomonadota bacterium]
MTRLKIPHLIALSVALLAIGYAIWLITDARRGLTIESLSIDGTPARIFSPPGASQGTPVTVIAHGFAGSQRLMEPFAVTLARQGIIAVTFDFEGHGENPQPMRGDLGAEDGTTRYLLDQLAKVVTHARARFQPEHIHLLGHSMATDVLVRESIANPIYTSVVAVSMFSQAVEPEAPGNLLILNGAWEPQLNAEAIRVLGLTEDDPEAGITYGRLADGDARRAVFVPGAEHVAILYRQAGMAEASSWIRQATGMPVLDGGFLDHRGPAILGLIFGVVLLGWPVSRLLPRVVERSGIRGANLPWRRILAVVAVPAILTPLTLRAFPTDILPVLVADYLALHFLAYGLFTFATLLWVNKGWTALPPWADIRGGRFLGATVLAMLFVACAFGGALHFAVTVLFPSASRVPLAGLMMLGTITFFLATEWALRGNDSPKLAPFVGKIGFILSLVLAIALDFEGLFFLILIVPFVILFLIVYGLFVWWASRATGHPWVGGIANGVALAIALSAAFPVWSG